MITLEKFKYLMGKFRELDERERKFSRAVEEFSEDSYVIFTRGSSLALEAIEAAMEDSGGWIDWWVYEKGFGARKEMRAFDKDKKEIPSETLDDLYDLVLNHK